MANEVAARAGGAEALPPGIKRSEIVRLPVMEKLVEIRRWSYPRLMQVSKLLGEVLGLIPDDLAGDVKTAMGIFYDKCPDRILEIVRLSVVPEHRAIIDDPEIDGADVLLLVEAVFDLNDAGQSLKKAAGLATQFLVGKAAGKAQQESETKTPAK